MPNETGPRVLIVDDIPANVNLMKRRLEGLGYQAYTAFGGEEALKIVENGMIEAVLLDIRMPKTSGTDVLLKIRERFSMSQLPVIMVTALADAPHMSKHFLAGANDYITKPVDFRVLQCRLSAQLKVSKNISDHQEQGALESEKITLRSLVDLGHGIAHEINNPLAIISGNLSKIEESISNNHFEDLKKNLSLVSSNVSRIRSIISGLKEYSHMTNYHLEPTDLAQVKSRLLNKTRLTNLNIDLLLNETILTSAEAIERLFEIIESNTIEHTHQDSTKWMRVSIQIEDRNLTIKFLNSTPAISESLKDKVFEPFYSQDKNGKLPGLGLSIARSICRLMKGDITIEYEGGDQVFLARVPLRPTEAA